MRTLALHTLGSHTAHYPRFKGKWVDGLCAEPAYMHMYERGLDLLRTQRRRSQPGAVPKAEAA